MGSTSKETLSTFFTALHRIGRAVMLPIAMLPAAGILLGIGIALQEETLLEAVPFLNIDLIQNLSKIMSFSGQIIFDNLPILFAVGVAVGLSGEAGAAALAATIGFLIMNKTIGVILNITIDMAQSTEFPEYTSSLGIPTLQTGVFGGIIVGALSASLYNKFYKIKLPVYLGFFSGKRFVPIVTAGASLILGVIMAYVWPNVQESMNHLSRDVISVNETLAAFIFGVIERGLIPFGLHHIFYSPFWYEFGEYINVAGEVIRGDQRIFFSQLADNVDITAGTFMTGKFPFMMFGLPAAALAMYHEASPDKKKYVAGIYGSAALTSFLTGITEPLEFAFLFVAPFLFFIHTLFAGLSFMVMHLLNVKIGMTFSGGVIDFLLFGVMQNKTAWWWVIIVGLMFSIIYYFGFRFAIRKFDIKIAGRETSTRKPQQTILNKIDNNKLSRNIINSLGGIKNIISLDSCITRLRVVVKNIKLVEKENLYDLGANGVLIIGDNVQIIFGTNSGLLKTEIENMIYKTETNDNQNDNFIIIKSPLSGTLLNIRNVPDKVFSKKLMGEGFAIIPSSGDVLSPVDGVISNIFPTKHAVGIIDKNNLKILIHVGIDTIKLNGEGFESFVSEGDTVKSGDLLIKVDIEYIRNKVPSIITPILINIDDEIKVDEGKIMSKGENIILSK